MRLRLAGRGERRGIVGWSVRDLASLELDGLPTTASERPPAAGAPHPNGVVTLDHLVVMSPALDRTTEALERRASTSAACARATRPAARRVRPSSAWAR